MGLLNAKIQPIAHTDIPLLVALNRLATVDLPEGVRRPVISLLAVQVRTCCLCVCFACELSCEGGRIEGIAEN